MILYDNFTILNIIFVAGKDSIKNNINNSILTNNYPILTYHNIKYTIYYAMHFVLNK